MTNDPISLIYKESIDSTNLEARRILDTFRSNADIGAELKDSCTEGADSLFANRPFMVVAREQTAGRGRQGKSFYSPKGSGINISTEDFPDDIKGSAGSVLSLTESKDQIADKSLCITKNLTEAQNTCTTTYRNDDKTLCMTKDFVQALSMHIYDSVIKHLDPSYNPIADYKERSVVLGHDVTFYENEVAHSAHAVDIDEEGGLVVRLTDTSEIRTLSSGEISLRVCEQTKSQ